MLTKIKVHVRYVVKHCKNKSIETFGGWGGGPPLSTKLRVGKLFKFLMEIDHLYWI